MNNKCVNGKIHDEKPRTQILKTIMIRKKQKHNKTATMNSFYGIKLLYSDSGSVLRCNWIKSKTASG